MAALTFCCGSHTWPTAALLRIYPEQCSVAMGRGAAQGGSLVQGCGTNLGLHTDELVDVETC